MPLNTRIQLSVPCRFNFIKKIAFIHTFYIKIINFLKPKTIFKLRIFLGKHSLLFSDYKKDSQN